jgi:IS30 family transposase
MGQPTSPQLVSAGALAKELGVHRTTVDRMRKDGRIKARLQLPKSGQRPGAWRYDLAEVRKAFAAERA